MAATAFAIRAVACRMRSSLVAACSRTGMRWPAAEPAEHGQHGGELGVGPEQPGLDAVQLALLAVVKAHEVLLSCDRRSPRAQPAARVRVLACVRARIPGRSAAGGPAQGDGCQAGRREDDQHAAGHAVGPEHRVGDGELRAEDGPSDDQPDAQQRAAELQAGECRAGWPGRRRPPRPPPGRRSG